MDDKMKEIAVSLGKLTARLQFQIEQGLIPREKACEILQRVKTQQDIERELKELCN